MGPRIELDGLLKWLRVQAGVRSVPSFPRLSRVFSSGQVDVPGLLRQTSLRTRVELDRLLERLRAQGGFRGEPSLPGLSERSSRRHGDEYCVRPLTRMTDLRDWTDILEMVSNDKIEL